MLSTVIQWCLTTDNWIQEAAAAAAVNKMLAINFEVALFLSKSRHCPMPRSRPMIDRTLMHTCKTSQTSVTHELGDSVPLCGISAHFDASKSWTKSHTRHIAYHNLCVSCSSLEQFSSVVVDRSACRWIHLRAGAYQSAPPF